MQTGMFTALDGGVYDVTSQSGYVVIIGKTLYPGQDALIGNEMVSQGSSGLVANGATVILTGVSTSSMVSSSDVGGGLSGLPASSSAASQSIVSTFVSTSTRSMEAASTISTVVTVASDASTASSAAAAATQGAKHMIAAVGGIIGLMIL